MKADPEQLLQQWRAEQQSAAMTGWDFSYLTGRCRQGELPWDLRTEIIARLQPQHLLLDMDTGGGEFLQSLQHPPKQTWVTENYEPNVAYCRTHLEPLGVQVTQASGEGPLPFAAAQFEFVTNRHGSFLPEEVYRVLKPGGIFATQQVGAYNERELIELLLPEAPLAYPNWDLAHTRAALKKAGLHIERAEEAYCPITFYDVGALVWFARILPWEFPGFSVETHADRLFAAQQRLEAEGCLQGRIHRFLLIASKPE